MAKDFRKRFDAPTSGATREGAPPARTGATKIADRERFARDIASQIENLPSPPAVVFELMRIVDDQSSKAKDFEGAFKKDQVLTAKVLKLVNSSFFAQKRRINTIADSVVVLGYRSLKSLVLAATTSGLLSRPMEGYGYKRGGMWMHSIAVAAVSRWLGGVHVKGAADAEDLFVAGLLHDLGKVVLSTHVNKAPDGYREAFRAAGSSSCAGEEALTGFTHARVGEIIAKRWNLTGVVAPTLRDHHRPETEDCDAATRVVALADYLCNRLQVGLEATVTYPIRLEIPWLERLGLPRDFPEAHLDDVRALIADMEAVFAQLGRE